MKIVYNHLPSTVILANGRIELHPAGSPRDHRQISDEMALLPDVQKFLKLGKISILTLEEAAKREKEMAQAQATAALAAAEQAKKQAVDAAKKAGLAVEDTSPVPPAATEEAPKSEEPKTSNTEEADDIKTRFRRRRH